MDRSAGFLFAALLATAVAPVMAAEKAAAVAPVVAQELMNVRVSERVQAATWTRRTDSYTLQLMMHSQSVMNGSAMARGRRITPVATTPAVQPQSTEKPEVEVWLLRADGTQLVTRTPRATPPPGSCALRCNAMEILYRFSLMEASQAVAAVVRIGDSVYIEKLESLEPDRK
jgi:hypothetical protein